MPPAELAAQARFGSLSAYRQLADAARRDPEAFWAEQARSQLHWFEPFHTVLDWSDPPFARWFEGGTTNLSFNCLDRHLSGPRAEKTALIWEGEPGDTRTFTYRQLHAEVCKAANALKALGIGKGDLVALYMPMIPEAAIAMLACARIGAPHSVVFGGFSADALRDRLIDGEAKLVITADGGFRKDRAVPLKPAVDEALEDNGGAPSVEHVLVVRRLGSGAVDGAAADSEGDDGAMSAGRDVWWHELVDGQSEICPAEPMASEDRLFVLYTSGSTGKPKGVVHTTAGYNLWAHLTFQWIFDIRDDDI
ncbi:MAG: AMP-binding protein, partial [Synechococcaceae cyanobacterium]|nr:AMP-binding protein [Synechococcaceae cyanobacterium]